MLNKPILFFVTVVLLAAIGVAQAESNPAVELEEKTGEFIDRLSADDKAITNQPEALDALVNEMVVPLIDFEAMSKLTLSKHWRKASKEERAEFMEAYKGLLARTYTKSLSDYAGQRIIYFPERTKIDGDYATVYCQFDPGNGKQRYDVRYEMRQKDGQWLVYDLVIDGLSFVKNYRTSFSREIEENGLPALIARLKSDDGRSFEGQ